MKKCWLHSETLGHPFISLTLRLRAFGITFGMLSRSLAAHWFNQDVALASLSGIIKLLRNRFRGIIKENLSLNSDLFSSTWKLQDIIYIYIYICIYIYTHRNPPCLSAKACEDQFLQSRFLVSIESGNLELNLTWCVYIPRYILRPDPSESHSARTAFFFGMSTWFLGVWSA